MRRPFARLFLAAGAVAGLAGCVSAPVPEAMAVSTPAAKNYPYSVAVQTRGGGDTSALGGINLSPDELKAALEKSITDSRLFRTVVKGADGADYELAVTLTQMDKPVFGASFTVQVETAWSLTKVADKKALLRKVIKSSHVATMGDAVVAATRVRLAVEGAVKKNIELGLQEIAALGSLD